MSCGETNRDPGARFWGQAIPWPVREPPVKQSFQGKIKIASKTTAYPINLAVPDTWQRELRSNKRPVATGSPLARAPQSWKLARNLPCDPEQAGRQFRLNYCDAHTFKQKLQSNLHHGLIACVTPESVFSFTQQEELGHTFCLVGFPPAPKKQSGLDHWA